MAGNDRMAQPFTSRERHIDDGHGASYHHVYEVTNGLVSIQIDHYSGTAKWLAERLNELRKLRTENERLKLQLRRARSRGSR